MKKLSYLIVLSLILGLVLTGCSLLSNIGQAPATEQSGITYLTKEISYSDLVALWNFDDDDAYDSSGNSNDGTVEGATFVDSTVGMGRALSFVGNDYVYVEYSDTLDITGEITIEAWIKPTVVSGYRTIVAKRGGSVANYALRLWNGKVEFYYRKAGATQWSEWYTTEAPVNAGNAYRIAVTYTFGDDNSIKVYVDDTLYEGSWLYGVADEVTANGYPVYIGCVNPSQGQWFSGLIDEVRIWNFALSQDQLGKVYDWDGFFRPVDNPDVLNVAKAGRAIPVKFSLNGDQGFDIFVPGCPKSKKISCDSEILADDIIETITAGGSSLNYDDTADQYIYVWKTETAWAGTCRQLVVKLIDGTSHVANFKFK